MGNPGVRRRLLVSVAVSLTTLVVTAGPLAAAPTATGVRYADKIFSTVKVRSDITYGTTVDQITHEPVTLKLDMYTPEGDTDTSRPAIVWVHGGSFCCGDKTSLELVDEAHQFAMKGYVNVSIDYRLASPGCSQPTDPSCIIAIREALEDAQTAVRFLRAKAAKFGVDPTRIAIGGSSAGAITAVNVGYASLTNPATGSHKGFSSAVEAVQSLSGCAILTSPAPGGAPELFFHGTADPLVPYSCATGTVARAQAAGLVADLVTWPGQGHVPYVQTRTQILNTTTFFFYWQLDLAHAK
jgi:para-nitrobenzyl esterase